MIRSRKPSQIVSVFIFLLTVSTITGMGFLVWSAHGASTATVKEESGMTFMTPAATPTTKPTTYPVAKYTSQQQFIPTTTPTTKPTTYPVAIYTSQQRFIPTTTPTTTRTTVPSTTTPISYVTTQTTPTSTPIVQNAVPSALLSALPDYGTAPLTVLFDGSGSTDPEGGPLEYHWDFGDGSSGEGSSIEHVYEREGSYRVYLVVTDPQGLSDIAVKIINIGSEMTGSTQNLPPQASMSAEPTEGSAPLQVSFASAGTADPEGLPLSFLWDFGDGITSNEESLSHTYQSPGHYVATLLVTDAGGFSDIRAIDINVRETVIGRTERTLGEEQETETQSAGFDMVMLILLTGFACSTAGLFIRKKQRLY